MQLTKQAFAFVFDRVTGQPVWPIEERPGSAVEHAGRSRRRRRSRSRRKPPAFDRQGVAIDDLIDFTPELRAAALEIVKQYVIGPDVHAAVDQGDRARAIPRGTIQLPGSVGGADWQGGAFDPDTGLLYVPSITGPFVADIVPGNPKKTRTCATRAARASIRRRRWACRW